MTDFIIRTSYTFRDERLFPPGWRSFSNLVYGINHIELTREFIGRNGINGEKTTEVIGLNNFVSEDPYCELISINDLNWNISEVVVKLNLEISNEIESINRLDTPSIIEISSVNDLSYVLETVLSRNVLEISRTYRARNNIEGEKTNEIYSVNDLWYNIENIISKNILEISNELIGINSVESPKTNEIILINDLSNILVDIDAKNVLEISEEIFSLNDFESPFTREYLGVNFLSEEKINEIISFNDIFEKEITTKEFFSLNNINDAGKYTSYSHIIYIYIDDILVNEYVDNWKIEISSDSYVNSASVSFVNKEMFNICNQLTGIGTKRLKIIIDNIEYNFMIEKREPLRTETENGFMVWGRSLIATLDLPYSIPIIDKEIIYDEETGEWYCPDDSNYVPRIWQKETTTAKTIIESVIGSFVLDFQINDFIVRKGSFSVTHSSPISIINSLANVVGAYVNTDLEDKVVIKYRKFNVEEDAIMTFSDDEDIFLLSESVTYPEGYNKILIKGYEDPITESSTNLNLILDTELNEEKTQFDFGDEIWIRLYKSPFTIDYSINCSLGELNLISSSMLETVERETAGFLGKTLNTEKPIITVTSIERYNCQILNSSEYSFVSGFNIVNSESSIEDEPVLISYTSQYNLYRLVVTQPCDPIDFTEVLSQITAKQD